jgi:hypothetical protein
VVSHGWEEAGEQQATSDEKKIGKDRAGGQSLEVRSGGAGSPSLCIEIGGFRCIEAVVLLSLRRSRRVSVI